MRHSNFIFLLMMVVLLSSCHYSRKDMSDSWDLTPERLDSIAFAETHHYYEGYNFEITSDSMSLLCDVPNLFSSLSRDSLVHVYRGDRVVTVSIMIMPTDSLDSVWVKLARDQRTMGWVHEADLLEKASPDDPISQFIKAFSNSHLLVFFYMIIASAVFYLYRVMRHKRMRIIHVNDIESFYPTLLCLSVSGAATFYALMLRYVPETWQEYYFHPTLNPFGLPFILSAFLFMVWLLVILFIAVVDDVRRQLDFTDAFTYLLGLLCVCVLLYTFFTLTITHIVGVPCLVAYAYFAVRRYMKYSRPKYVCGKCGAKILSKGLCPHCNSWNE